MFSLEKKKVLFIFGVESIVESDHEDEASLAYIYMPVK